VHILCVDQFSNWGGGQRSLLDLLSAFSERGWEPHVVLPGEGVFREELRRLGYRTSILKSSSYTSIRKPSREIWRYARELPELAREIGTLMQTEKVDLLYVNGPRFLPPAAWVARKRGTPLVFHCHHRLGQSSAAWLSRVSLRFSRAHVIACCKFAVEPLVRAVDRKRISVIYNGVLSQKDVVARPWTEIRRIGVIGRIEREKGQMEFVEAARLVTEEFPRCRFVIAGSPMFSDGTYYNQVVAASTGLPIEFMGWQNDVSKIFSKLDLVIVPSTSLEATTRIVMEAFAFGVPVVALPSGGIPEIINDNETGFLAESQTSEDLAKRIRSVLTMEPEEIDAVTSRAQQVWREHFTVERYRNEVCSVLSKAAGLAGARVSPEIPLEAMS
jgi:glycosyltransferase involved in cell wall biosynthesis